MLVKNPLANAGDIRDVGSIPGSGRYPGEENDNQLLRSCLGDSMDRGAWQDIVHGVEKSRTRLSFTFFSHCMYRQFSILCLFS